MQKPAPRDLSDVVVHLRKDFRAQGYTDNQIARLVRAGTYHRIRWGAYVLASDWDALSAADQHRLHCRAVLRRAHEDTVLTHVSSAVEQGAPVWGIPLDKVHTTRTSGKAGRREPDWIQHRSKLADDDIAENNGVRFTKAPRCAVEVTTMAGVEASLVTVNGLLHSGATTKEEIEAYAKESRYWPHSLTTNLVLRLCDARIESPGETRVDYLCFMQGLPRPVPQVEICDERGHLFARVDFAWPERGVFLEFDGKEKYEWFRRPGESLEDFLMREKRREEQVCTLTGWVCIRITWADLANPAVTAARIRAVLESRAPRGA